MTNIINRTPYLDNQRTFSTESDMLSREVDRAYIESALAINDRTIGIYPQNNPAITGNSWFPTSQKLQSLRQIYTFTSTSNISHGIEYEIIEYMGNCFGTFTDGTNWYGLQMMSSTSITGQITFYIDPTSIVFVVDGGAPSLTKGLIVLEWVVNI